ncbi:MAG TPA: ABC transporter ATP-binding protein [Chloroflexota bacterium]|nr:ABC transporter ATP-binding protein [Chloroflexota bacterium]
MEAVRFDDVSKRFIIHHERARTFQEAALNLLRLRRVNGTREEFWALRNVSFGLERGRTLGVIGRNGSGKSTLLKLLAGTMRPTAGQITAHGRVFGLLELAAGFHPDLSGRENVFLNGAFLGLSRRQMAERFEQIVAFAELEQFIDTPVKHYSSGMYMRLGFAIAISVEPDILVIDEVLAVGDAAFRQKCFAALAEFKARQKTILFVTHDAAAVRRFCDEAIWLDQGQVRASGPAGDVLGEYLAATGATHGSAIAVAQRQPDPLATPRGAVTLLDVTSIAEGGRPERHFVSGQQVGVRVRCRAEQAVHGVSVGVGLHRADGLYLWGTSSAAAGHQGQLDPGESEIVCWLGHLPLAAAEYTVSAAVWTDGSAPPEPPAHRLSQAARFAVRPPRRDQDGPLVLEPSWEALGHLSLSGEPLALTQTRPAPAGRPKETFIPGSAADQARPVGGFHARWRRAPSRLTMGQGEDEFLGPGWYPPEDWPPRVRWTTERAIAYLTQDQSTSAVGVTMGRPQHEAGVTTGRLYVGGHLAGRFELATPALEPFTFPVDPLETAKEVEVVLQIDQPIRPATAGRNDDQRSLGVAVCEIWLE